MFSGGSDNDRRYGAPGGCRPDDGPGKDTIATGNGSGGGDDRVDSVHAVRCGIGAVFIGSTKVDTVATIGTRHVPLSGVS